MTLQGSSQAEEASVRQLHIMSEHETQIHRDLALEVYRKTVERFGVLPDVLLVQLARTSVEQLIRCERNLDQVASLEEFVVQGGWVVPQGGEGNYPITHESWLLPFEERRLIQDRLDCLRKAQVTHSLDTAASIRPLSSENHALISESDALGVPI